MVSESREKRGDKRQKTGKERERAKNKREKEEGSKEREKGKETKRKRKRKTERPRETKKKENILKYRKRTIDLFSRIFPSAVHRRRLGRERIRGRFRNFGLRTRNLMVFRSLRQRHLNYSKQKHKKPYSGHVWLFFVIITFLRVQRIITFNKCPFC